MIKKIFKIFRKIVISSFLLYGYNILAQPLNLLIPINIITVSVVSFLGVPALLSFVFLLIYIY
jgi:SigmaK-factor processing regulatory protein BofA.